MSGVVHFKFKSSNSYDSVGFDGAFISVSELKVLIAEKKGLSKDATSELLLSDPRTQVGPKSSHSSQHAFKYTDIHSSGLIPRNSTRSTTLLQCVKLGISTRS